MNQYPPTWADDHFDNVSDLMNANLLNPQNAEAPIDAGVLTNYTITTGWNLSLIGLLINGLISFCWGVALAIFASGVVPVTWAVSQYGKSHQEITNVIITLVATASTTHIKYTTQAVLLHYSQYVLVDGFTVGQLAWMQGIKEWSLFTDFKSGSRKMSEAWNKRVAWLVIYAGMAVHSASVVSILQPNTYYQNVPFDDPIPCGTDPNNLSLAADPNLPPDTQSQIDQLSFEIGLQLGNYIDQVGGNTTTSGAGRVFVKDNFAYGAVGGLSDGAQEVPGVSFNALCINNKTSNTSGLSDFWGSVFPGRAPPTISLNSDGSQSFSDQPIPSQMRSVISDPSFNLTGSQVGMYALVNPSGSGGLLMVNSAGGLLCCVWETTPKIVSVQTVNFTAQSLGAQDSKNVPQLIGRSVLFTLQGMAAAVHLGANLDNQSPSVAGLFVVPPTGTVLQVLLADGGKVALTSFTAYFTRLFQSGSQSTLVGVAACDSHNRTIAAHWKFGNSHNLGWVAIIWTIGIGILAVMAVMWFFTSRPKVQSIKPLEVPYAIVLGRVVTVDGIKEGRQMLRIRSRKDQSLRNSELSI